VLKPEDVALAVTALVAVGSLAVNAAQARFTAKRGQRQTAIEERAQGSAESEAALKAAQANIALLEKNVELLEKQNAELTKQGERREEEWRKREEEWHRRERKLEDRVEGIDQAYKELVKQIQSMGQCVRAAMCKDYDPGDRRGKAAEDEKPGGTD